MKQNSPETLGPLISKSVQDFEISDLYTQIKRIFLKDELIEEVKNLNKKCCNEERNRVYTIDRVSPYLLDSQHKGISRVLQGYEVVLLTVLARHCLDFGALPLSLDHDGILVMMPGKVDVIKIANDLSDKMNDWSLYLLDSLSVPIEPKILIKEGEIFTKKTNFS